MDDDAANRLIEERDALKRATGWVYNERDQPTRKLDPPGSAYDVNYTYDELGRRTGTSATQLDAPIAEQYDVLGRRTHLQHGTGTTSFQYDDLSRITSAAQRHRRLQLHRARSTEPAKLSLRCDGSLYLHARRPARHRV